MDGRTNRRNKAAFCDGLVWTVGLTVEIKLGFQISLRELKFSGCISTDSPHLSVNYCLTACF